MTKDYEQAHAAAVRQFGAECAVLLRQDGSFPLAAPGRIALYGGGARRTVKGGTGSGEVNSRYFITIEAGLELAGFTVTTKAWLDGYDRLYDAARRDFFRRLKEQARAHRTLAILESMGAAMPEPEYNLPRNGAGDTAVYVLSRISGEGSDRGAEPGDVLLTETERRDILALNEQYEHFLLVLNVGGVVDLTQVSEVKNILLLSQLGAETGNILADLILGKTFPSGRLAATWSAWGDYPQLGSFGEKDETRYHEGIYVGYRYFDAVGKKALFPFGYGLGYTMFVYENIHAAAEGAALTVTVEIQNTGRFPGKETAQLYVSPPSGKLDKPRQALAAFAKTRTLQPGETETLTLSCTLRDLASYDRSRAAWVLESGDYVLRLGKSSAETEPIAVVRLEGEAVTRRVKNALGRPDFSDWKPEPRQETLPDDLPVVPVCAADIQTETVDYDLTHPVDALVQSLTDEELCLMNIGAFHPGLGAMSVIGDASKNVAGAAGETVNCLKARGVPALVMADGPAGLRLSRAYTRDEKGAHSLGKALPESMLELLPGAAVWVMNRLTGGKPKGKILEQNCTAIPIGTAIAQSWNPALAEACGDIVGDEMERFGVHLWLAPALNLHRDIRCGRNFEYFSEDPLLTGKFAAALVRGVQRHPGCGATVKHFCANNQETNRYYSNSQVSERALRELYLRGFEIAVRESKPRALMTSYNLLNGTHTAERRDLLEDVLRAEFGFDGVVMTDWLSAATPTRGCKYGSPRADRIAAAGNDLTMPGAKHDLKAMLRGLKTGTLTRRQLEINAARVLRLAKELTETQEETP